LCSGFLFFLQVVITYPVTWDGGGRGLEYAPGQELYYTDEVSKEDALRLGQKLREVGIFDRVSGRKTVVLSKRDEHFVVRFFLRQGAWNDGETIDWFDELRDLLSKEAFGGASVEIVLCDRFNREQKILGQGP
jgi:hypothetical protein